MNLNESAQMLQTLRDQQDSIADKWYQEIARTGYVSFSNQEIRQHLLDLTERINTLMVAEPFEPSAAEAIGERLAKLHYLQPEVLGRTLQLLHGPLLARLSPDQILAIQPNLALLSKGVAIGFCGQLRTSILTEQEETRSALLSELGRTETALRKVNQQLETRVAERTQDLLRANEELRAEIAERQRVEKELRESEETARALIQAPTDSVVLLDRDYTILDHNVTVARIAEADARADILVDGIIGTNIIEALEPDRGKRLQERIEKVFRTREPLRFEGRRTGRWLDTILYPIFDASGDVTRLALIAHDITERKQSEQALKESEEKYRDLIENISDIIYAIDQDGTVTYVSPVVESCLGYRPSEIIGRQIQDIIHADDVPHLIENLQEIRNGHKTEGEYRAVTKSGELRWIRTSSHPILEGDQVVGAQGVMTDITDRKLAEAERDATLRALETSEERWRSLVENAPDTILTVNREGKITFINRSLTDPDRESMIGQEVASIVAPEYNDVVRASIQKVFDTGESGSFEVGIPRRSDAVGWYAAHLAPIRSNEEVTDTLIINRDITQRKQMEIMKDNLVRDVSHELRTPLAKLQMSLQLLEEIITKETIDQQRAARISDVARRGVGRLLKTVEGILDLSSLETGSTSFKMTEVYPRELITSVVSDMESMAGAKGLDLTADLPLSLPTLKGDWNSLFRVLTNLIDNAIKFSDKGQIVVSAEEKSGEIEIVVRDEGQGILPEHLEMIFERFFQEKNRFPGVGVGLTICQAVVTAHDGRIWAESPGRGQGATFRFTLPVVHP